MVLDLDPFCIDLHCILQSYQKLCTYKQKYLFKGQSQEFLTA
jgi:hypothetical protein